MLTAATGRRHFHRPCCTGGETEAQGVGVICTRLLSKRPVKWGTQTSGVWAPCWGPRAMTTEWGQNSSQIGRSGAGGQGASEWRGLSRPPCRRASGACGSSLGSRDCSRPAWSSHSDLLHPLLPLPQERRTSRAGDVRTRTRRAKPHSGARRWPAASPPSPPGASACR